MDSEAWVIAAAFLAVAVIVAWMGYDWGRG